MECSSFWIQWSKNYTEKSWFEKISLKIGRNWKQWALKRHSVFLVLYFHKVVGQTKKRTVKMKAAEEYRMEYMTNPQLIRMENLLQRWPPVISYMRLWESDWLKLQRLGNCDLFVPSVSKTKNNASYNFHYAVWFLLHLLAWYKLASLNLHISSL